MKNYITLLFIALFGIILTGCGYERIDAGHTGIKVKLYGTEKGVQDVTQVTGAIWYWPFSTNIYEVPTFVQNVVYQKSQDRDEENQEFRVTTKNGLVVKFDVSMNYRTPDSAVVRIFKKYRKPVRELERGFIRNYVREAFNKTAGDYTASELYEKRNEFEERSELMIREMLEPEGFIVEQVVLLNELRLPPSVVQNIEAKINATQTALRKQEELAQAQADAQKKIAEADGRAQSLVIQAKAEAEANALRQRSLTKELLMQQWIEKWNGELPTVSSDGQMMLNLSNLK
jgi:regulator of protease activity HflC (stomatin/prohibitin superfamily)